MPSTRAFAANLGLSRGTVVAAYDQLQAEGYLEATPGSGTRVEAAVRLRPARPAPPAPRAVPRTGPAYVDLRPGTPDVSSIVSPPWRAAWRKAVAHPTAVVDPLGLPAVRLEIAEHLRMMRALVRPPGQILVTSGAREGLALLLQALSAGRRRLLVGVEQPGHPALLGVPAALGIDTLPMQTDDQGLVTAAMPQGERLPDVVVVTPSHQYPNGGSLSLARRQELLGWAGRTGTIVVEDDYDSELRYVGMPLPALATLDDPDNGSVVLLGTFSTVLTPAVATGYLVAPARLIPTLSAHRLATGLPTPALVQQALADYLASGELRRHIQRMRRDYRRRRRLILDSLGSLPNAHLAPLTGGLHAVVHTEGPGAEVAATLAAQRILVGELSGYWGPHSPDVQGIVFGFGAVAPETLAELLPAIARACRR
ncbi:GntR family transcriptional regulator / MocR family aminotransferase [Propionibacterium cyclohexanicum]|uniref:GntR family transcriptional regulator / MocR family aminotransferase n=2 Tax=Propionibacterium cyclohexanicum TaxID=64702 RepID=A0A1H9PMF0_9ACTN|nr:GntR family transcriptional regulator / MocR family aminotransferase [Propionibacterium cyclohexanicum]